VANSTGAVPRERHSGLAQSAPQCGEPLGMSTANDATITAEGPAAAFNDAHRSGPNGSAVAPPSPWTHLARRTPSRRGRHGHPPAEDLELLWGRVRLGTATRPAVAPLQRLRPHPGLLRLIEGRRPGAGDVARCGRGLGLAGALEALRGVSSQLRRERSRNVPARSSHSSGGARSSGPGCGPRPGRPRARRARVPPVGAVVLPRSPGVLPGR
jgi:hypothetical protein